MRREGEAVLKLADAADGTAPHPATVHDALPLEAAVTSTIIAHLSETKVLRARGRENGMQAGTSVRRWGCHDRATPPRSGLEASHARQSYTITVKMKDPEGTGAKWRRGGAHTRPRDRMTPPKPPKTFWAAYTLRSFADTTLGKSRRCISTIWPLLFLPLPSSGKTTTTEGH